MGEMENTAEDVQDKEDPPKKKKKVDKDDVKTQSMQHSKNKKSIKTQEEDPADRLNNIPHVDGLNDTETALKNITVKVRNKLLFNTSVMEGGWFDQVCNM